MKFELINVSKNGIYWYTEVNKTKSPTEKSSFSFRLSDSTPFGYHILTNKKITKAKVKTAIDKFMKQAIEKKKGSFNESIKTINLR